MSISWPKNSLAILRNSLEHTADNLTFAQPALHVERYGCHIAGHHFPGLQFPLPREAVAFGQRSHHFQ